MSATPLPFIWPHAVAFWLAYLWAFYGAEWNMIRASKTTAPVSGAPPQDSLRWLTSFALVAQVLAFAVAFWAPARLPPASIEPLFWTGIALLFAGSALRRHCFRMLGESFTIDVRASATQPVIDRGAYAVIRHPGYTAGILMLIAVGLALGSFVSLVILTVTALLVYLRRIRYEETVLEATLGDKYRRYAAGRKRLVPFVY